MFRRNLILNVAAASIVFAAMVGKTPGYANQLLQNSQPVGPHEPILASIGEKRLVASFAVGFDFCALDLSVWDSIEAAPDTSVHGSINLARGEVLNIENLNNRKEFLALQCSDDAKKLLILSSNRPPK